MNDTAYKKLSLLLQKYCPDFLVDNYPGFISFLQAYYDWSMMQSKFNPWSVVSHIIDWGDIDTTIDEFIIYFKDEYLNTLNTDFNGDLALFIKHSKEFYASRGTPESFRFLLRLLSGNSGSIFYPGKFLMKSSDGVWRQDYVMYLEFNPKIDNSYISTIIKSKYSNATAVIERIETHFSTEYGTQFFKLVLSNVKGNFSDSSVILEANDGQIELSVYDTVSQLNIITAGNNYKVDEALVIQDDPTFLAKIKSIYSGIVDSYAIFDGGSGYNVGDEVFTECESVDTYYAMPKIYVSEVDASGAILGLDIRYSGYGFYSVPTISNISGSGSGANIELISLTAGAIRDINILNCEINYTDDTALIIETENGIGGSVTIKTGNIYKTIPYYFEDGSFLSDEFKLQDSDYWQDYSYEIQSSITLESNVLSQFSEFKEVFQRLVHPAGFKLFNSFILSNTIQMPTTYINSTIGYGTPWRFLEFVNWLEMVSYWNRILDEDIIFQQRLTTLSDLASTTIDSFERIGGEYVHSTIEVEA